MADCKIRSFNAVRAEIFGVKPTFPQRIILLRSQPHVHTEFQFSERNNNRSFSSTLQDGAKGTRFKDIKYSHEKEWWDTVIVPMTDNEEDRAYREALRMIGMSYDLKGQLAHVTGFKIWRPSKKKIWCTKAVGRLVYVARPDFKNFLNKFNLVNELRPDQMDFMARYYFGKKNLVTNKIIKELTALITEYEEMRNGDLLVSELRKLNETN